MNANVYMYMYTYMYTSAIINTELCIYTVVNYYLSTHNVVGG